MRKKQKITSGHNTETAGFLLVASDSSGFDLGSTASTHIELPFQATDTEVNHDWKTIGHGVQIRLVEDQTRDRETFHVNETVHAININTLYLTQIASANGNDPSVLRLRNQ